MLKFSLNRKEPFNNKILKTKLTLFFKVIPFCHNSLQYGSGRKQYDLKIIAYYRFEFYPNLYDSYYSSNRLRGHLFLVLCPGHELHLPHFALPLNYIALHGQLLFPMTKGLGMQCWLT